MKPSYIFGFVVVATLISLWLWRWYCITRYDFESITYAWECRRGEVVIGKVAVLVLGKLLHHYGDRMEAYDICFDK